MIWCALSREKCPAFSLESHPFHSLAFSVFFPLLPQIQTPSNPNRPARCSGCLGGVLPSFGVTTSTLNRVENFLFSSPALKACSWSGFNGRSDPVPLFSDCDAVMCGLLLLSYSRWWIYKQRCNRCSGLVGFQKPLRPWCLRWSVLHKDRSYCVGFERWFQREF